MGKKRLLIFFPALVLTFPLFAYLPGDLVLNPELQLGFEIPMIRQNTGYPEGKEDGSYVSLGFCWGLRLSASYRLNSFFSVAAGVGFEGVHNQYNFTYYIPASETDSYTERWTYDTYYWVIPAGFRAHFRALSLGAGLSGYIPLFTDFSGEAKQSNELLPVADENFKADPFLGAYFDIGYDWAEKDEYPRGFNMNLRVEASFSDKIASGNADYKTFRHIAISLTAGYSFRASNLKSGSPP
ncbi:MAG: hypothetical protein LBH26_06600 [Treponema sp.]|nr:hypothetical protein [Treponema sp.]